MNTSERIDLLEDARAKIIEAVELIREATRVNDQVLTELELESGSEGGV